MLCADTELENINRPPRQVTARLPALILCFLNLIRRQMPVRENVRVRDRKPSRRSQVRTPRELQQPDLNEPAGSLHQTVGFLRRVIIAPADWLGREGGCPRAGERRAVQRRTELWRG